MLKGRRSQVSGSRWRGVDRLGHRAPNLFQRARRRFRQLNRPSAGAAEPRGVFYDCAAVGTRNRHCVIKLSLSQQRGARVEQFSVFSCQFSARGGQCAFTPQV